MRQELPPLDAQGARVRLRLWHRRDLLAQELWPHYTEPFNTLWNIPRSSSSFDDEDASYLALSPRRVWAVEDQQRTVIGRISLREIDAEGRSARLGITLGAPYVSKGLGTEALLLFLDYFFGPMGFATMVLDVAAFNLRAVRCYERLGFRYVGSDWRHTGFDPSLRLLDDPAYQEYTPYFRRTRHGMFVQFYEMEIYRNEWQSRRGAS